MNILEFTRSTHVRNKIVVGNYHVVQLVVNFGISTMLYVPVRTAVVARVDNLSPDGAAGRGARVITRLSAVRDIPSFGTCGGSNNDANT